jgi:hypothetical protein
VDAPASVFEAARKTFEGKPETWSVIRDEEYYGPEKTVVTIADSRHHVFVCLVGRDRWIRLNDNGGIPFIDQLVSAVWKGKFSTATLDEQRNYSRAVVALSKGEGWVLSGEEMELYRKVPTGIDSVLGSETRISELTKFFVDPVLTQVGSEAQLAFYVVTGEGAIERWTVHGREDKRFVLRDITIQTMREKGSFIW